MKPFSLFLLMTATFTAVLSGAETAAPSMSKVFDQQVSMMERELVPLAEAMPADKYSFVPTGAEFSKSRTFGQQVSHVAAVLYMFSAALVGEKPPTDVGESENGPATLKTKDDIVKYLKDAFAYTHKAMAGITADNLMEMIPTSFGKNKVTRLSMATAPVWHSFDHYGQMAIYARMVGIVPPASR